MKLVMDWASAMAEAGFWWLLSWSWQSAVVIVGVWLGLNIFRVKLPALRHHIWLLSLVAAAGLPIWNLVIQVLPVPGPASETLISVADLPRTIAGAGSQLSTLAISTSPGLSGAGMRPFTSTLWSLLFVGWVAGAVVSLFRMIRDTRYLSRLRREAQPVTLEDMDCGDWKNVTGGSERVRIAFYDQVGSPILAGIWRPSILLPPDFTRWTTAAERRAIIEHEIAHLARLDHYVNLFLRILNAVFYFHPLVILARKQLEIEREMACDDRVIDRGTKAEIYVESILKVAGRGVLFRGMRQLGMISSKKILEKRIGMIMNEDRARYVINYRRKLALSVAMISLVIWTMTPAHSESHGSDESILGRRTLGVYQASFEAKLTAEQGEQLKQASAALAKPYIDSIAITPDGKFPIKTDSTARGTVKNAFPLSSRLVIRSKEFENSTTIILTEEQRQFFYKVLKRSVSELQIVPTQNDEDMTASLSKSPRLRLIDNLRNTIIPDFYGFRFYNRREAGFTMVVVAEYRNIHRWLGRYFPQLLPDREEHQILYPSGGFRAEAGDVGTSRPGGTSNSLSAPK